MADLSQWLINTPDLNAPGVADFLANIRKYDPNAQYVQRQDMGSDSNLIGSPYYHLSYDPSKLPGQDGTGQLSTQTSSNTGISDRGTEYQGPNWITVPQSSQDRVIDPSKVNHSSIYGNTTDAANLRPLDPPSWLDYAPLLVAAFGFGMGGIPGLFDGFGSQFATGGATATDPFLAGGTGAMDMTGSYGTGIPGSLGAPMGGAESSLYGADALTNPAGALGGSAGGDIGGLTQAQWDEIIAGQPENGSFIGPNGTDPNWFTPGDYNELDAFNQGLDNPSLVDRLTNALKPNLSQLGSALGKIPGLGGSPTGLIGGGNSQKPQTEDAVAILRRLYGSGLLGAANG